MSGLEETRRETIRADTPPDNATQGERRKEKSRLALLIRTAKIITEMGEFLCLVRDVSTGGVRLSFFHDLPRVRDTELELANGSRWPIEIAWMREMQAGCRFVGPVDVKTFIAETSLHRKRPLRLAIETYATIRADSFASLARVVNVSRQGARITSERPLALGQLVRLEAEGLPQIFATVCWRDRPNYGLLFRDMFTMEELARLSAAIQLDHRTRAAAEHHRFG